jgi:TetR/AcrR family transcriptional repressor of nem operon
MNKMTHPHCDTREHLLATGQELSLRLGFNGMGLTELLKKAEVPKGSFYHHFRSKEAFGEAMIQRYYDGYDAHLLAMFSAPQGNQRQHLLNYYAQTITNFCASENHNACLSVKLSAEVSDLSEPMRHALEQGTVRVVSRLKDAVEKGIAEGSLQVPFSPAATASALYSMWLGASLLAKIKRSVTPLATAVETIETFLQEPNKS